jgi:hypothetical protein
MRVMRNFGIADVQVLEEVRVLKHIDKTKNQTPRS